MTGLRTILSSRFSNVVCFISSVLNVLAVLGLIVALVRIHNSGIPASLLATAVCCAYLILPAWYLARALGWYKDPKSRFALIILKTLCVFSAFCIVLVAMVCLGVVGAHFEDFPGASLLGALALVAVFSFLPFWYFLHLLSKGR